MFSRRLVDPTSKRAFFSNAAILVFVGLIASFLVVPIIGMAAGPTVTPPAAKQLLASTPNQDPGDFVLTGFEPGDLLVTVGLENPPAGTTFSISTTDGLTHSYGYTSWVGITEVSFVASSTGATAMSRANTALASMTVSTGATPGPVKFKVSAMPKIVGYAFNPVNQSFYKVSSSKASWNTAKTEAEKMTYDGVNGYLATITSAQENTFITNNILGADNIWIGASDAAVEQTWRWVTGPEAGTQFWQGYGSGSTVGGQFASWATGEPNGDTQDYALTNWQTRGLWDDQGESTQNLYLIEFSQTVSQSFVNLKSAGVTHNFPDPTITPPSTTDILAPGSSNKVNKFVVNGYGPDSRVRVSIKLLNQPLGSNLSIGTTTGLTLSAGFTAWTNFTELSFVGKQADINTALDNMTLTTPTATEGAPITGVVDIEVTTVEVVDPVKASGDGDIAFNPENGHYYQFIAGSGISFTAAQAAAKTKTYIGLKGYLVTITSSSENNFVSGRIDKATNVWIGASDAKTEGTWQWIDGPEAGTDFWSGKSTGSSIESRFESWSNNEPNDYGSGEDYAVTNWGGGKGAWNDLPNSSASVNGYVVEFSGTSQVAPPIITESFRYSIGLEVKQTTSQAVVRYPVPDQCKDLSAATDGTCTATVTATDTTDPNAPPIVVPGCAINGPCVVPLTEPGTYKYEVDYVKNVPALDVVTYNPTDPNVGPAAASCTVLRTATTGDLCRPSSFDNAPAESFTTNRAQLSDATTTVIDSLLTVVTPPAEPADRLAPSTFDRDETEENQSGSPGSFVPPTDLTPKEPSGTKPKSDPNQNQQQRDSRLIPPAPLVGPVAPPATVDGGGSAQIGGRPVDVESQSSGENDLSVSAGDVNLNINVPSGSGAVNNSGGAPQLEVKRDKAVALEGEGMLPGSTVQVWLPGSNKNTELGRITVGEDGSFSGDVSFSSSPDGAPLPIGSRVIQLTGVDRNGNQTVINLNVNIAQPDPAPELFRGETSTPQPGFGNFEASNAGIPEQATLTAIADQKQALVEGNGWSLSLQLSGEGSGITENAEGVFMTLVRGEAASFGGDGFMPGTIASIWLFSEPTQLGEVTIAADGSFSGTTAALDEAIATGEHTIQIQGVGEDGFIRSANLGVVVAESAAAAAPFAFFDWLPLILLGLLIAAGSFFAIAARRRRKADGSNVIQFPQAA